MDLQILLPGGKYLNMALNGCLTPSQVPSWRWYYPYHYAPFAADFALVEINAVSFDLGQPFTPLEQLMSVLPAARYVLVNLISNVRKNEGNCITAIRRYPRL